MTQAKRPHETYGCSVTITSAVHERIQKTLAASQLEEGGKFLGRINVHDGRVHIQVQSFIDSGPNIDHSAVRLFPDGQYQERVFREVEASDPEIEHIGSWHSHHCNGLDELSEGDIEGYYYSVNHRDYNLNHFFVALITKIEPNATFAARYYLFIRGQERYHELEEKDVRYVDETYLLESLLAQKEQQSFETRRVLQPPAGKMVAVTNSVRGPTCREQLRADRRWFAEHYPNAEFGRDPSDGSLLWRWNMNLGGRAVKLRFRYRAWDSHTGQAEGCLEIKWGNEFDVSLIRLGEGKFDQINAAIADTKGYLLLLEEPVAIISDAGKEE